MLFSNLIDLARESGLTDRVEVTNVQEVVARHAIVNDYMGTLTSADLHVVYIPWLFLSGDNGLCRRCDFYR